MYITRINCSHVLLNKLIVVTKTEVVITELHQLEEKKRPGNRL